MDRLILMRHGKAERDSTSGDDFDRPLTRRGRTESAAMAATLADLGLIPDLVLVSAAARTRETWAQAAPSFPQAKARFERALYHADEDVVRKLAELAGVGVRTVMVVGHNPGLQDLTVQMLGEGAAAASLIGKAQSAFPTAAASVFLLDDAGRPHYDGLFFPERG